MKPTHQHMMFGNGKRKCGDETKTTYIDDFDYRRLPYCEKCFPNGRYNIVGVESNTQDLVQEERPAEKNISENYKRFLRDYQKEE